MGHLKEINFPGNTGIVKSSVPDFSSLANIQTTVLNKRGLLLLINRANPSNQNKIKST